MFWRFIRIILLSAAGFAGVCGYVKFREHSQKPITESIHDYCTEEKRTYDGLTYYLFTPLDLEPGRAYPLIVFYHGGDMHLYKPGQVLPVKKPTYGLTPDWLKKNPCFILIPQAPETWWNRGKSWSLLARVHRYIDRQLCAEFPIDRSRLYTIGYSAGGTGIFHALAWYPDYYAAAIPLAGWLAV